MNAYERSLILHEEHAGKISVTPTVPLETRDDLSLAYTPGVAQPCREIAENPDNVYRYTSKSHMVAVLSDGSAVLGLGNIGAAAAIPVMEGKAALFSRFAGIDAFPICVDTQDVEEILQTAIRIAPVFGGINLEDISAPRCFEVEQRLQAALSIPVFHDDQHGTAIIVAAGLLNALKVVGKELSEVRIVINGIGAAGTAILTMLEKLGAKHISPCDRFGLLCKGEPGSHAVKDAIARKYNPEGKSLPLKDVIVGADVFIGVSAAGVLSREMAASMAKDAIVFANANPEPEITREEALAAGVRVIGTGRSDYPNQVNNCLAFPGLFKGALEAGATCVNDEMKRAAVYALASLVSEEELHEDYILPSALDPRVAPVIAQAVAQAARDSGVTRC